MTYRHLFWDFDGTLFNSYPQMVRALRRAMESSGCILPDDAALLKRMKQSGYYAMCCAAEESNVELKVIREKYIAFHAEETSFPPYEGMEACIRLLKKAGFSHYLYTHRDQKAVAHLKCHGLFPLFSDFVTSEDQFPMKPAPDALLALLKRNKLDAAECLMIGDREIDIESGLNAGMQGLLFDPDGFYPETKAELRANSMEQIAWLLAPEMTKMESE